MWVNLAILVSISLKTVFVVSHFHLQNGVPDKVCCQQSFHGNTIMSTSASCEFRTVRVGNTNFTVDKCYSNLKEIGSGAYGVVAKAVDSRTGRKVAIKKVKHVFCNVEDATRILRELKLLSHFKDHENVVQLLDVMAYPPNTEKFQDIYIVTNFMDKNLGRVVDSAKQKLSDQHLQYFLYQILRGLKYVHSANVLHRDLKPENIVINVNCDLALCDFGLSRGYDDKVHHLTEYVVTRHYRPPELLLECAMYGKPVDVWSVGCIFAELILRRPMFCGETPQHQLRLIVEKLGLPAKEKLAFVDSREALKELRSIPLPTTPPSFATHFPAGTNSEALDLLEQMLRFSPSDRISVEKALEHPFLKDFHGHMSEPVCETMFDFSFETIPSGEQEPEVRRMMYEEICKFRPGVAAPKEPLFTPPKTTTSPLCSPRIEETSPLDNVAARNVFGDKDVGARGAGICYSRWEAVPSFATDLQLRCSTDRQSCDTNDTVPGIHLFGRSDSNTLYASGDSTDLTRSHSTHLASSLSASYDFGPIASSQGPSQSSASGDSVAEKGIAHQMVRRKSETLPTPAPHAKEAHSLPPAVPRLPHQS